MLIIFSGMSSESSDSSLRLPFGNLQPFTTDNCSNFPNGTRVSPRKWAHCCVVHDRNYWIGGSYEERTQADIDLFQCVKRTGESKVAYVMYMGVRAGGNPFVKTTWRWGYGWPKLRGYAILNEEEILEVEKSTELTPEEFL